MKAIGKLTIEINKEEEYGYEKEDCQQHSQPF
jgi:hypothetical protein